MLQGLDFQLTQKFEVIPQSADSGHNMQPATPSFSQHLLNGNTFGQGLTRDTLVIVPASMVNATSTLLLPEQSYELMVMNYRENFLNDALMSNFAVRNQSGEIELQLINKAEESFVGSLFEAWVCRELLENPAAGLAAFRWATGRPGVRANTYRRFVPFVTASAALKNDVYTAQFYNTADTSDIRFHAVKPQTEESDQKPGLALIDGTTLAAGIQVKAIRKNLIDQIVKPLIENQYQTVLTLLTTEEGWPSALACRTILQNMVRFGQISPELGMYLMGRIKGPDEIGLQQFRVDAYAHFARQVYARHKRDSFDRVWLNLAEVPSEVVTPAVAAAAAEMNPVTGPIILPESGAIEVQQRVVPNGWGGFIQVEQGSRLPRLGHR
ncbi:hypothetical protein [Burkholderia ubonensis]|uniref:hypothetical protein n=1 Tax=Burkholderia ubonensis TaxID=101571 RepID=UPI0012FC2998|nr:hypothetical protein [Burkholderia ubonensis]